MKIEKLERALAHMSNKALIHFVKKCVCQTLTKSVKNEVRDALDMVYVECSRRGQERLYDTAYASVSQHPERCEL